MKVGTGLTSSALRRLTTAIVTVGVAIALPAGAYAAPVRVVIDPGHGGKDPGAMSKGVVEKKTNLKISRAVAKEARRQGWDVKMTRKTDKFVPLVKRPAKANSSRADVFVSIHSNSTGKAALGNMTIYRTKQGKRLGRAIMSELKPMTSYKDIGNRRDVRGLAVLRASKRPAVIVEVLSVTASRERRQLKSEKAQKKYARAIVRGIAKYENVKYKPLPKPKAKKKKQSKPVSEAAPRSVEPTVAIRSAEPTTVNQARPPFQPVTATASAFGAARGLLPRLAALLR